MKSVLEQKGRLKNKKVLLRLSLNVPIDGERVQNDFKLRKILPTIEFLRNEGAKILILGYAGRKRATWFFESTFWKPYWRLAGSDLSAWVELFKQ